MFKGLTGENQTIGGADDPRFGDSIARSLNRVGEQVNQAARAFSENFVEPFQDDTHNRYFWARIYQLYEAGGVGTGYRFRILTFDATGHPFYQNSDEVYERLFDIGGNTGMLVDQIVMCMRTDDDSGMYRFYIIPAIPHAEFPVALTRNGGANGTAVAACTYLYDVKTIDGAYTLTTTEAPLWGRAGFGSKTVAVRGRGYYTAAGAFVLNQADEEPGAGPCSY